jgi:hypothetical protein
VDDYRIAITSLVGYIYVLFDFPVMPPAGFSWRQTASRQSAILPLTAAAGTFKIE